jgi:thiosulfate dehydrogenase (quinone) large subunit
VLGRFGFKLLIDASLVEKHFWERAAAMADSKVEQGLIVYFRITMAWTFLYAASHQVFDPNFTVVGFLGHTKTFHDLFSVFTTDAMAPITTFVVEYGHC